MAKSRQKATFTWGDKTVGIYGGSVNRDRKYVSGVALRLDDTSNGGGKRGRILAEGINLVLDKDAGCFLVHDSSEVRLFRHTGLLDAFNIMLCSKEVASWF